jgi:hypothetical protein
MRTPEEINKEIKKLVALQAVVVPRNVFGESNIHKLQAAIDALNDRMSEDQAYDLEASEEWGEAERENAVDAIQWMDGESNDPVSEAGWPLKKA